MVFVPFVINSPFTSLGSQEWFLIYWIKPLTLFAFSSKVCILVSFARPIALPKCVNLSSALSCLSNILNSALEVNILYGSSVPLFIKSSMRTPIYASDLFKINSSLLLSFKCAFMPAIKPWQAASSYPVVPFIWPAKYRLSISFVSKDAFSCVGWKKSYSIA